MNRVALLVTVLVIGIALGFTMWAFSNTMTPYVTIDMARKSGVPVQVRGKILRDRADRMPFYDSQRNALIFWLEDVKKEVIKVEYQGGKPDAFDTAPETAAHGMIRDGVLRSDKLIVKCPSKYEGNNSRDKMLTQPEGLRR